MVKWDTATAKRQFEKDCRIAKMGQAGKRIKGTSGRCTLAVDQETYIHTVEANGGVQAGGKTIFDDKEFTDDMKRTHPHLRVEGETVAPRRWGTTVGVGRFVDGVYHFFNYKAGTVRIGCGGDARTVSMEEFEQQGALA